MYIQKQEVWQPGSADMVCPRPPLMTRVQHFVSRINDLWPWRSWCLWLMRVVVLHPYTKFEVRIGFAIWKIWRTMCVSVNGPCDLDLDLWPMTLKLVSESHLRWGTGTFLPNLGTLGLWVLELFAMYATDGQTDKSNAYCPLPYGSGS